MRKFSALVLVFVLFPAAAMASAPTCDKIAGEVHNLKYNLIEQARTPMVSDNVLDGTRTALNTAMAELNDSGLSDDSCPVSELSGEIAQILQAVNDLRQRSALFVSAE